MRILLSCLIWTAAAAWAAPEELRAEQRGWRSAFRCGPNSLYVLLTWHGIRPEYERLVEETMLTDKGASAAELMRVSDKYGLPLVAIRAEASALDDVPLPAVAHFYNPAVDMGHYVLLLSHTGDNFTIMECTQGKMERLARGDFLDRWSGILIVRRSEWNLRRIDHWLIAFSVAVWLITPTLLLGRRTK